MVFPSGSAIITLAGPTAFSSASEIVFTPWALNCLCNALRLGVSDARLIRGYDVSERAIEQIGATGKLSLLSVVALHLRICLHRGPRRLRICSTAARLNVKPISSDLIRIRFGP